MRTSLLFLACVASVCAQFIVSDPGNTAVSTAIHGVHVANHVEVMRQWAEEIDRLNRQLRQLEEQLSVQQRIREVMGDPSAAGAGVVLRDLGAEELARTYGETLSAARRLSNSLESLRRTSNGINRELEDRTVFGRGFVRQGALYCRFAVVERQADTLAGVQEKTDVRIAAMQADIAATLAQLKDARTQAEVDKLNAKLAGLNGQLGYLDARRREEEGKLATLHLLNENQAAKERLDFLENQQAEERQSLDIVGAWQASLRVAPVDFSKR